MRGLLGTFGRVMGHEEPGAQWEDGQQGVLVPATFPSGPVYEMPVEGSSEHSSEGMGAV